VPFRGKRSLRDNNLVQSQVAQAEARLRAARAYLLGSLEEITAEVERSGHLTLEQRMVIRLASTFAIHQSLRVVDTAYHAAGSTAIFEENPIERRFRDIHTVSQQLQGRQEHFETSASTCSASNLTPWPGCEGRAAVTSQLRYERVRSLSIVCHNTAADCGRRSTGCR
jgi:hypothetical protein